MPKFEWYTYGPILSRNALINLVAGPRSIGKTFGAKAELGVRDWLKNGQEFLWMRRTDTALTPAKFGFFDGIARKFPGFDFRVNGEVGEIRTDGDQYHTVCRFAPLSLWTQYKGSEFVRTTKMIYDEAFIEKGEHYLPDEVDAVREFWTTINRDRTRPSGLAECRVFLLGNPRELDNPYFMEWGFDESREWQKGRGTDGHVILHLVNPERYERRVDESIYGKALGTRLMDHATGKYFKDLGGMVIDERPADSVPFATLVTTAGIYGLWEDSKERGFQNMYVTVGMLNSPEKPVVAFEKLAVQPGIRYADNKDYIRRNTRRHYGRGSLFYVGNTALASRPALAR